MVVGPAKDSMQAPLASNRNMFSGEDSEEELEHLPEVRAIIVKEQKLLNDTWYIIRLVNNHSNEGKHVMRRYEDFVELDESLKTMVSRSAWGASDSVVSYVPDLPRKGRFGLRSSLSSMGIGNFNEQLKEGFQMYLDAILLQVHKLELVPPLNEFFSVAITDQTRQRWDGPKMRQAVVKTMTSQAELAAPKAPKAQDKVGADSILPINENNAAVMMVSMLRSGLHKMDQDIQLQGIPRTDEEAKRTIFREGTRVLIVGLQNKMQHNAKAAVVADYLQAVRQYYVTLEDGKRKRVRDINLRTAPKLDEAWDTSQIDIERDDRVYKENILKDWSRLVLMRLG